MTGLFEICTLPIAVSTELFEIGTRLRVEVANVP